MKIGINFGDNDFTTTIESFLALLKSGVGNHHSREHHTLYNRYTKEHIARAFNQSASGIYWMKQNGFCYDTDSEMCKYLQISENNVYIDVEVDAMNLEDNNCEFHWIEI